ncbi:MAG: PIN/TRAM domain-containing protein [Clostridia bacterium]|nr:PIN/TRAM domain-containing protein [Clostridia bacterium]
MNTKSPKVMLALRVLLTLLGAGIGAAAAALTLKFYAYAIGSVLPLIQVVLTYTGFCLVFGAVFLILSKPMAEVCFEQMNKIIRRLAQMSMAQVVGCITGLIVGLLIASLITRMVAFLGNSMFTTVLSAILYMVLGIIGWSVGWLRGKDMAAFFLGRMEDRDEDREKKHHFYLRKSKKETSAASTKLLDTSAIIDGRILDVWKCGFLEGDLVVPQFVLDELQRISDSADDVKRAKGRRGLELLQKMKEDPSLPLVVAESAPDETTDVDARLLHSAKECGGAIVTCDYNLNRVATIAGIRVLNVNELAGKLRPAAAAGDKLRVQIVKEGKERQQGIGYTQDGTMVVVEEGKPHLNETIEAVVTSVLQTNAGRMIFARLAE